VVKVVDRETDEVIRQIPPEELMNLTQRLNDLRGNIVDTEG
jgi:flagellar protein FlaG